MLQQLEDDGLLSASEVADIVAGLAVSSSIDHRLLLEPVLEMYQHSAKLDLLKRQIAANRHKIQVISQGIINNHCKKAVE